MEKTYIYSGIALFLTLLIGAVTYNVVIGDDYIEVKWEDEQCAYGDLSLRINEEGVNKLKCGRYIVAEWDTQVLHKQTSYYGDSFRQDYKKPTLTELRLVENTPEYFIIQEEYHYKLGATGSDGVLIGSYKFTKNGVKWSYDYQAENDREHYIVLRMKRFEPKYGLDFFPEDPNGLLVMNEGTDYYYGGISGDLSIDPEIVYPSVLGEKEVAINMTHDGIDYQEVRVESIIGYDHWENVSYTYERCSTNYSVNDSCWNVNSTVCCNFTRHHLIWNTSYNGTPIYQVGDEPIAIIYGETRYNFEDYGFFVCDSIWIQDTNENFTGILGNGISIKNGYSYNRDEEWKCKVKSGESAKGFDLTDSTEIFKVGYYGDIR